MPIRFVQIGSVSDPEITLQSVVLRSWAITPMGSGLGSTANDRFHFCIGEFLRVVPSRGFAIAEQAIPLFEVERLWGQDDRRRRIAFIV